MCGIDIHALRPTLDDRLRLMSQIVTLAEGLKVNECGGRFETLAFWGF
jgi:hypothetical protein